METPINLYRTAPCLIVKDSLLCLHQGNTKTYTLFSDFTLYLGQAVAQLVGALPYKPKVAGSILVGFSVIFHWHNPSGRTMALGLTQPLTEMSTRNISWG